MNCYLNPLPVFSDRYERPFVFWEESRLALIIRHGNRITVIFYEPEPVSCLDEFLESEPEIMIRDYRGRIVASYVPKSRETVVKRDGRELRFKAPGAIKRVVERRFDNDRILSFS